jgi:hypothetical protein
MMQCERIPEMYGRQAKKGDLEEDLKVQYFEHAEGKRRRVE